MTFLYEQLTDRSFQRLCQAVLADFVPGVRCFPVGQADGGRDASLDQDAVVFQVKWTERPDRVADPVAWLSAVTGHEKDNIVQLYRRGTRRYVLLTNLWGTAKRDSGQIDRLDVALEKVFGDLPGLEVDVWWRDTLDRHIEARPGIQWSYPQILTGTQAMALLLATLSGEDAARRERAVRAFLASQFDDDIRLRFKQIGLAATRLFDLFVDVPAGPDLLAGEAPAGAWLRLLHAVDEAAGHETQPVPTRGRVDRHAGLSGDAGEAWSRPAASLLLASGAVARIALLGGPGQGKSTLLQYVCQVHRARLLNRHDDVSRIPAAHRGGPMRVPFRLDLKAYARWRRHPAAGQPQEPPGSSIEQLLSTQVSAAAGGVRFDVADLHAILAATPALIALDGLDEVADVRERQAVADEIEALGTRLAEIAPDTMVVVTTRPSALPGAPVLRRDRYLALALTGLPRETADDYVQRWINQRDLRPADAAALRSVWSRRRNDPHIRDLARTVMQLAILLHLMHARGDSIPDRRTQLYDEYVKTVLDREAEKDSRVACYRDVLEEAYGHLAFALHAAAERSPSAGSVDADGLKTLLRDHLSAKQRNPGEVDELFIQITDRVVALVSRVEGAFEFEVQPLREYFAGRYLYDTAPYVRPGQHRAGTKEHRLQAMLERPFWANVARFYAGCFHTGELAGLVDILTDTERQAGAPTGVAARLLTQHLLSDRVFARQPAPLRRAVRLAFDGRGRRLASGNVGLGPLTEDSGAAPLAAGCLAELVEDSSPKAVAGATRLLLLCRPDPPVRAALHAALRTADPPQRLALLDAAAHAGLLRGMPPDQFHEIVPLLPDDPRRDRLLVIGDAPLPDGSPLARQCLWAALDDAAYLRWAGAHSEVAMIVGMVSPRRLLAPVAMPAFINVVDHDDTPRPVSSLPLLWSLTQLTDSRRSTKVNMTRVPEVLQSLDIHVGDQWTSRVLAAGHCVAVTREGQHPDHATADTDVFTSGGNALQQVTSTHIHRHQSGWWREQRPDPGRDPRAAASWLLMLLNAATATTLIDCLPDADAVLGELLPVWAQRLAVAHLLLSRGVLPPPVPARPSEVPRLSVPMSLLAATRFESSAGADLRNHALDMIKDGGWSAPAAPPELRAHAAFLLWRSLSHITGPSPRDLAILAGLDADVAAVEDAVRSKPPRTLSPTSANIVLDGSTEWPASLLLIAADSATAPGLESLQQRAQREGWFTEPP